MGDYEALGEQGPGGRVVLLNSLNSGSLERERACEFGDTLLKTRIPLPKVCIFHRLLPGKLRGEEKFAVIGGVYEVSDARR